MPWALALLIVATLALAGRGAMPAHLADLPAPRVYSPAQLWRMIDATRAAHGLRAVPTWLALLVAWVESEGDSFARGSVGEVGLMQVRPSTAADMAQRLGFDAYAPDDMHGLAAAQLYHGLAYLAWLRTYAGRTRSWAWVVQSYNAGPGRSSPAYLDKLQRLALRWHLPSP